MKIRIRGKIIISFSLVFGLILGITLISVYYIVSANQKNEFRQYIKEVSNNTLLLFTSIKKIDQNLSDNNKNKFIDSLLILDLKYDVQVKIFDSTAVNLYASSDNIEIPNYKEIIGTLKRKNKEYFVTEKDYEIVAQIICKNNKCYFIIGKAKDTIGKAYLKFLAELLGFIFFIALAFIGIVTYLLTKQITTPIIKFKNEVDRISAENLKEVKLPKTKDEIASLALSFNNMIKRVDQSLIYRNNFIHHVSHELKTPIAILVSNIEKSLLQKDTKQWKESLLFQKNGLMLVASIIDALLEIAKHESEMNENSLALIRLDELIFETMDELSFIYPLAEYKVKIEEHIVDAASISCKGNERLLKVCFYNLLKNAIEYSASKVISINISIHNKDLQIIIKNNGAVLNEDEQQKLFQHFFRGENSRNKKGIGLGLVMVLKIINLHKGRISYQVNEYHENCFIVFLPKS